MSTRTIRRTTAALAVVVGAVAASVPAPAGAQSPVSTSVVHDGAGVAVAPCSFTAFTTGSQQTGVLAAHAVEPGAVAIRVRCGIVVAGRVVASVTASGAIVATNAIVVQMPVVPFTVCTDRYMVYADGGEVRENRCPF
ncbi:MAG TPA: hypothetical protein VG318_04975 [Actinomycetota bacterium]|nr:hypothetical protein [Actinomycetota bacterium]